MRWRNRLLIAGGTTVLFVLIGATTFALGRHAAFSSATDSLEAIWAKDITNGVPTQSIAPLRQQLLAAAPTAPAWSPIWITFNAHPALSQLQKQTETVWNSALSDARHQAQQQLDQWNTFAQQQTGWIDTGTAESAAAWPKKLQSASTPAALNALTAEWKDFFLQTRAKVKAAQKAKLDAEFAASGGPETVLLNAGKLQQSAAGANLDDLGIGTDVTALQSALNNGSDPTVLAEKLLADMDKLQGVIDLNNQIYAEIRPLMLSVDQAQAESTPQSGTWGAQYQTLSSSYHDATTADALHPIETQISTMQAAVNAELSANQCGHSVGSGKVITISLSLQEMIFYQDGCVAQATPVSTGRPQLRTPTGTFHIFYKTSPFQFISPWPKDSPFYYYPSWVSWVMEFADGGYFIHDAPWEAADAYGPGSEDSFASASHGCVHVPTSTMQWAYSWAPVGTPVVISQ